MNISLQIIKRYLSPLPIEYAILHTIRGWGVATGVKVLALQTGGPKFESLACLSKKVRHGCACL